MIRKAFRLSGEPILALRGVRALADGLMAASFAALLYVRGFDERALGWMITATLLGSAATLVAITRRPAALQPHRVLVLSGALMAVTGAAFAATGWMAILIPLAVVGPLNPTGGDVSAFLPAEQAIIANRTGEAHRSTMFARYSLVGFIGAVVGALLAGPTASLGRFLGLQSTNGIALAPAMYATIGVAVTVVYWRLGRAARDVAGPSRTQTRLIESRRIVHELTAVFALDSAGGGFVGNALVAAWLMKRFDFDLGQTGAVLAVASAASAFSSLLAPRLSRRFGLVETMVFTHAPANVLCILAGLAPTATVAVVLLVVRALLSQLDVPPRQTFVMTLVPAHERSAAAAFTNLPRSLAAAVTPPIAGWLLYKSSFGWPLIVGGSMKLIYDGLLLARFRQHSTKV